MMSVSSLYHRGPAHDGNSPQTPAFVHEERCEYDEDAELVRRHLAGDGLAFEALFHKYRTQVFGITSRMVGRDEAYDLTQEAFCKALTGLPAFRGTARFSTWLYRIATNVCLNRLRSAARTRTISLDDMRSARPGFDVRDDTVDLYNSAEIRELQRVVDKVLAELTPEQRLILTLRDFEQLSYSEIAETTGTSVPNVRSRLHRARMAFKTRFSPYLPLLASHQSGHRV